MGEDRKSVRCKGGGEMNVDELEKGDFKFIAHLALEGQDNPAFREQIEESLRRLQAAESLIRHLEEAETKAWDSLARYKFQMFGYWAAIWVHLNKIGGFKRPNPWRELVKQAKSQKH